MKRDLEEALVQIDTKDWKRIPLEYGHKTLEIAVPRDTTEISMGSVPRIDNWQEEIERAFSNPIGSPKLEEIIKKKGKRPRDMTVSVTVSDITRPVPYKGEGGILGPILRALEFQGIKRRNIKIIVGTGIHRASTHEEKVQMYGEEIVEHFTILDHDCVNDDLLVSIGKTKRDTDVSVNKDFYSADLKIATGLVESHFMTGISGGRKAVCPGLVDVKTLEKFHGPYYLEDPNATNLILEGNPCHEEALEVAKTVGVDFIVNVTLDKDMRLTQVFAGDLVEAHIEAFEMIKAYAEIPLERQFDIVLTHGGYVGRDHYQTAKAGVSGIPAVKKGGVIIIAANNRDIDPIGSPEYKTLSHLLKLQGPDGYLDVLRHPHWRFTKDQWEPEVWAKPLRIVGEEGLIYCSGEIPKQDYAILPGTSGYEFLLDEFEGRSNLQKAQTMVQNALIYSICRLRKRNSEPMACYIREGPYAIPVFRKSVL
ncbi:MAG: nickel-dependent lactate racemase [Syntrophobacterales bacterium]|nr:MAG: nickel-dependent lactate racemase [Syntrophobacterales bacterium]